MSDQIEVGSLVTFEGFAGDELPEHADKLTEGTKALMKKYPSFRIDVYKTHRTVAYPDYVIKNTKKNAVKAITAHGGLSLKDARAGHPFPDSEDRL